MKHLVLVIVLAAFSTSAFSEGMYQDDDELRLVRAVLVVIEDDVRDGCHSNPNALKVEAELILRRSGISLSESAHYRLSIAPFGGALKSAGGQSMGGCVATLRLELGRFAQVPEGHAALIIAYRDEVLWTGHTKSAMREALRTSVSELVSEIANEILKARGN